MFEKISPQELSISVRDQSSVDLLEAQNLVTPHEPSQRQSEATTRFSNRSFPLGNNGSSRFNTKTIEGGVHSSKLFQNGLKEKVLSFRKEHSLPPNNNANLFRVSMENAKEEFHANKLMWKVHFKPAVFLKFFCIHLLAHCLLPVVYVTFALCYRRHFLHNLSLVGKDSLFQMFLWIFEVLFLIYFIMRTPADRDYSMALNLVVGTLLRTSVVALKYAYMSVPDLNILHANTLSKQEKKRHQLLTGWEVFRPMSVENEIKQAIERLQVEEEDFEVNFMERPHHYFRDRLDWEVTADEDEVFRASQYKKVIKDLMYKVKDNFHQTELSGAHAFVSQFTVAHHSADSSKGPNRADIEKRKKKYKSPQKVSEPTAAELGKRYSAKRVAREIVMMSLVQPRFGKILGFASILMIWGLPILTMAIGVSGWPLRSIDDYILCALAFPANFFIYYPNFQYLMVGISDFRRKVFFMSCTSKLIDSLYSSDNALLIPGLDLTCADNLYNWFKLRRVLLSVGKRFTARILSYLGCLLIMSSFMLVLLLLQYFRLIQLNFSPLTYSYVCFYILYIFGSCLVMMHLGVAVNLFFLKHIDRLRNFKLEFRRMIMKGQVSLAHLQNPHTAFLKQLKRIALLYSSPEPKLDGSSPTGRSVLAPEKEQDDFTRLVEVLSDVIEGLEHEYNHNSLKMLGIALTPSTMSTVWGFLFSILVAFISGNLER